MRNSEFNGEELKNIIKNSDIQEKEKEVLESVFSELTTHYGKFITHIKNKIYSQNKNESVESKELEIYSIVVPKESEREFQKYGFEKVYESNLFLAEGVDLDITEEDLCIVSKLYYTGKYFEKEKYIDKKNTAIANFKDKKGVSHTKKINYFIYDEEFKNSELNEKTLKLDKVIKKYDIESSYGFMPFKTRTFYAYFLDLNFKKIEEEELTLEKLDLQLLENGLEEFRIDLVPMWNIKLEKITPKTTTKAGDEKIDYKFIVDDDKNRKEFVIPIRDEEYEQVLSGNNINIITENNLEEFEKVIVTPINKNKINEVKIYSNLEERGYYNKKQISRIRTKADIENFLKRYNNGYKIRGYEVSNKPLEMDNYFKGNFPTEEDIFLPQYKCRLYIKFENDENDNLYVDYLKYMLDELKKNYPEIHWIGGI